MQFFKLSAIVAALMSVAAVTQASDWTLRPTQECALHNWSAIKSSVDSRIQGAWAWLPPPFKMALQQAKALNADNSLISNPSLEQIALIASNLPTGVFHPYADNIVDQCLANPPTSSTSSTSTKPSSTSSTSTKPSSSSSTSSSTSTKPSSSSSSTSTQSSSSSTSTQSSSSSTSTQSSTSSTSTQSSSSSTTPVVPSSTPIKCIPRPHY